MKTYFGNYLHKFEKFKEQVESENKSGLLFVRKENGKSLYNIPKCSCCNKKTPKMLFLSYYYTHTDLIYNFYEEIEKLEGCEAQPSKGEIGKLASLRIH